MKESTPKGTYVQPELREPRIAAQWSRIAERLPVAPKKTRARAGLVIALGVCAIAALLVVVTRAPNAADSVWEGSVVASDEAPVDFTLAEGTRIALEPRSEVRLLESTEGAVQLELGKGGGRFDVAKKRSRRFSVRTGPVIVHVTGTQFRVARYFAGSEERVNVEVFEGSVEVRRAGQERVALAAGESWSSAIGHAPKTSSTEAAEALPQQAPAVDASDDTLLGEMDPEVSDIARPREAEDTHRRVKRSAEPVSPADELFDRANVARRSGRLDEAARLFAELVEQHATDRHAALAAFELGRIRMDSLNDEKGAITALERSLALDPDRPFAEDALARLTLAYEAVGNSKACIKTRDRYLARYPDGVHAQHLSTRCAASR